MKRLLEWKQRMLQSPLTRKSSRNTSRAQTPTNSSSPAPSMTTNINNAYHGHHQSDHIRQKVLAELERHESSPLIKNSPQSNTNNTGLNSTRSPPMQDASGSGGNGNHGNVTRKVSRKGSGASRSSRSRSSPRVSNQRPTTSSSDEGKGLS